MTENYRHFNLKIQFLIGWKTKYFPLLLLKIEGGYGEGRGWRRRWVEGRSIYACRNGSRGSFLEGRGRREELENDLPKWKWSERIERERKKEESQIGTPFSLRAPNSYSILQQEPLNSRLHNFHFLTLPPTDTELHIIMHVSRCIVACSANPRVSNVLCKTVAGWLRIIQL